MNRQQAPNANHAIKLFAGLVLLSLVAAWVEITFDEAASPNPAIPNSPRAAQPDRPVSMSVEEREAPDASSDQTSETARQAARNRPETLAAVQAAIRAQEAQGGDMDVSPKVGRTLSKVIELLNADKFAEATAALEPMLTSEALSAMTPFERSRLYQLSFNLNMQAESYEAAQADIQAAIESGGLNARELSQMTYQNAQLHLQQQDYAKAADSLELWIAQQNAAPVADTDRNLGAYYLLAASYYYQDKFADARDHMETLFALPGEKQEGWYAMMTSLYLQNEDYAKAKPVVEKMVELFGDDVYREQLAGINAQLQRVAR